MSEEHRISYEALTVGTQVLSASGAIMGTVEHVLKDDSLDLFDGIIISTKDGLRFVDGRTVGAIAVEVVHTTVADADVAALAKPDGDQVYHVNAMQDVGASLTAHLGRLFRREHWKQDE